MFLSITRGRYTPCDTDHDDFGELLPWTLKGVSVDLSSTFEIETKDDFPLCIGESLFRKEVSGNQPQFLGSSDPLQPTKPEVSPHTYVYVYGISVLSPKHPPLGTVGEGVSSVSLRSSLPREVSPHPTRPPRVSFGMGSTDLE